MRKLSALLVLALVAAVFQVSFAAPRTVTMWTFAANNLQEWSNQKDAIEKRNNITLDIQLVAQDAFLQKLQAAQMSGEGVPDIIEWLWENPRTFAANPKDATVEDLSAYAAKSKVIGNVPAGRRAWFTVNGHFYGLPHDVHPVILIYNDTLWQKAGVDLAKVKTWDEFFAGAKKLVAMDLGTNGKPTHYALPSGNGGLGDSMFMIWQTSGSQIFDKNGKPTFTSKGFVDFVKWWKKQYDTGVFTSWDWGNFASLLKSGTLCAYPSPDWWVSQVSDAATNNGGIYNFKARPLPMYDGEKIQTASWGGTFLGIPKGEKDVAGTYKIIEDMQYNKEELLKRYPASGMLPPFSSIWGDKSFQQPDARFGGFKLGVLQTTMAKEIPAINGSDYFWDGVSTVFPKYFSDMMSGKITVEAGLKSVQDEVSALATAKKM